MSTPDVRLEVVIGFVGIFGIVNHYYGYVCRFPELDPFLRLTDIVRVLQIEGWCQVTLRKA
jgi:hypothetical protein